MAEILKSDNLKLLKKEGCYCYYLFEPTFTKLFPESGNMRKMTLMQKLRFIVMKLSGYRVYLIGTETDVFSSVAFSSGSQYRFPFAGKNDLIYGPSYTIPEHRGKGLAAILCEQAMYEFETNYKNIYCTIKSDNASSIRCMTKIGFECIDSLSANKFTRAFKSDSNGDHFLFRYKNKN